VVREDGSAQLGALGECRLVDKHITAVDGRCNVLYRSFVKSMSPIASGSRPSSVASVRTLH